MGALYLLKYNNYYNRIKKREGDSVDAYSGYMVTTVYNYKNPIQNYNLNIRDGINTEVVINWFGTMPNYVLYAEGSGSWTFITSRWFVTKTEFITNNQHKLYLLRDVVADYMDSVLSANAYLRRANLSTSNPFIYNSEGIQYNQIKKSETLLYDKTNTSWIVGYLAQNYASSKTVEIPTADVPGHLTNYNEILNMTKTDLKVISGYPILYFNGYYNKSGFGAGSQKINGTVICGSDCKVSTGTSTSIQYNNYTPGYTGFQTTESDYKNLNTNLTNYFSTRNQELISAITTNNSNIKQENTYIGYNGRYVKDSAGNSYKITVTNTNVTLDYNGVRSGGSGTNNLYNTLANMLNNVSGLTYHARSASEYAPDMGLQYLVATYKMTLTPTSFADRKVTIGSGIQTLLDAPYFMFAMKYTPDNLRMAIAINKEFTSSNIYDIQILPYCPCQEYFNGSNFSTVGLTNGKDYSQILNGSGGVVDYIIWCKHSTFTFDIPYTITVKNVKVESECDMYRLCSPNGNGTFEFNAAKNGGVRNINVDCTYKPINPYIHLNPDFSELYGADYNDFRGLILNGDFSIPVISDAWKEYEIQNKNYMNMFTREVQNLTKIQDIQRKQEIAQWITGSLTGGGTGAGAGMMVGGPIGAIAGGVVGAGASALGGYFDYKYNEELRAEQLSFKNDMFNMQLQNIQALPYSIAKTGCMTNNNKLVPYIEYYSCTEQEKESLKLLINKIGYKLGTIATISDYILYNTENLAYIEGDLIDITLRAPTNAAYDDYTIIMQIARELDMGIRLQNNGA